MRLLEFINVSMYRLKEFFLYNICGIEYYRNYTRFYWGDIHKKQINMAQQTAVVWLIRNVNENIVPMYIPKQVIEEAKKMEKREMTMFLRWVLKHYDTYTDSNAMFCWKNPSGQELDSINLVEQYYNETFNK